MAKTETQADTKAATRTLKKVSAVNIKLADKPIGFKLSGTFVGLNESEYVDKDGEVKKLFTLVIEDHLENRIKMLADAGLRGALSDAMVTKGDYFEAVKGDKENIGRGRTMNSWDVFQYAD